MTAAARPISAGPDAAAPQSAQQHPRPAGPVGAVALGEDLREVIDALRAAADLLVLHPLDSPYISVSRAGIHVMAGGEPGPAVPAAVDSLAALLGLSCQPASHEGRTWHTASGRLGRHHIYVTGAAGQEPGR